MSGSKSITKQEKPGLVTAAGRRKTMLRRLPSHFPVALTLGTVSQIGQVLFLRELLMAFQGNELSVGLILAAWLAWVGLGARLGAAVAGRADRPCTLLKISAAALVPLLPATILLMRGLRGFFDVLPGTYLSLLDMAAACFLLMAPACLLLGAQFVFISRLWRESDRAADTSGASKTYVSEAAGHMLGGLIFTFLLVRYLNSFQSAVLAGMLMLAAVLVINGATGSPPARLRPPLLALPAVAVLAFPFLGSVDQWAYRIQWRYFAPQYRLVETYQSKHGAIAVVQSADQYTFFQSGHLLFSAAGPAAAAPGLEEQEAATFAHLAMVQHAQPARILLIGGGMRGLLSEIARHPVERIDYIELDEALTGAAQPYLSPATLAALADPRVRLIHADGRLYLKTAREKYDLIIVDAPGPATAVLNRYYTREFFREAEASLNPGGVFVIGAVSTPDLRGAAIANRNATLFHTLGSVFANVLLAGEQFIFYFASNAPGQVSLDIPTLQERYRARGIEAEGFSPQHYQSLLPEAQLRRVNWIVRSHGRSPGAHLASPAAGPLNPGSIAEQERAASLLPPVEQRYFINADFKPIGYYYTLMFGEELTRAGRGKMLHWLLRVEAWWILALCTLPLPAVLLLRIAARRPGKKTDLHFAILCAAFTTGFSTMALQVALLFSFQSIYGFIYETVGLIVAVFMCGLALGAYCTNRYVAAKDDINILAGVQLLIALLAGLIAAVLPGAAAVRSPAVVFILFSFLTFAGGLINGFDFPLTAACAMALNRHAEKSAGAVYGVELFGACAGAVLASTVVAPVLGIAACCLMAAMANGTACIVLLIARRFDPCLKKAHPPAA